MKTPMCPTCGAVKFELVWYIVAVVLGLAGGWCFGFWMGSNLMLGVCA